MKDLDRDIAERVEFLREHMRAAGAKCLVFANSGGKDASLTGILCSMASETVYGVMMPCESSINYTTDLSDANALMAQFGICPITVDLTDAKRALMANLPADVTGLAAANINPRLRMTAVHAVAAAKGGLVVGTGNASELYIGYFTKFGDGGIDVNPIGDLPATTVFTYLKHLNAPTSIIEKAPSAGLYEGQTDEGELGFSYAQLDAHMRGEAIDPAIAARIEKFHAVTAHKRNMPPIFGGGYHKGE